MKKNDIAVGIYLLAAIVFLIVPMNKTILDVLLAFNIALSLVILLNAMFTKEVLGMSAFPTMLLLTTVFRISLNVSTT
ncbi:MAG TPA: EscV/YscV/HrcV family type III secretion system export apparatus protein, partial [Clostridiales bacterium]|nr:EscV/YscV/HrcV family type III secretion system export apparatus protein [Clostridiales bacterium]